MRFYDLSTPPERYESTELFPHLSEEEGAIKCLKLGLKPSVTTVLGTFREEYLERFYIKSGIEHFKENGNIKAAVESVYEDSVNAKFGTDCHAIIEAKLLGEYIPKENQDALKHSRPLLHWIDQNVEEVIHAETTIASEILGTAGTIDMAFITKKKIRVVGDLKVVKFSDKFPPKPGLAYRCQLSTYAEMLREKTGEEFQRWSFYLASPFGWNKRPDFRIFRHQMDFLPAFKAARIIWEQKLCMEKLEGELH